MTVSYETRLAQHRAWRAKYTKRGLCCECPEHRPVAKGHTRCATCLERTRKYHKLKAAEWIRLGLCSHCGGKRDLEGFLCSKCRESVKPKKPRHNTPAIRAGNQKRYHSHRALGLCVSCGGWTGDSHARCAKCRARHSAWTMASRKKREIEAERQQRMNERLDSLRSEVLAKNEKG